MATVTKTLAHYTVPMDRELKDKLKLAAAQEKTTGPAIVRRLVANYLEKSA